MKEEGMKFDDVKPRPNLIPWYAYAEIENMVIEQLDMALENVHDTLLSRTQARVAINNQDLIEAGAILKALLDRKYGYFEAWREVAQLLAHGARKYADWNWVQVPNAKSRYYDAALRHVQASLANEIYDEESELDHLSHALTNVLFLIELESGHAKP